MTASREQDYIELRFEPERIIGRITVRASPAVAQEVRALLVGSGIPVHDVIELSEPEVVLDAFVIMLSSSAAWLTLRSIIKTIVDRHKHKHIQINNLDARGFSIKEIERLLDYLQEMNIEYDKEWKDRSRRKHQLTESDSDADLHGK